MAVIWRTWPQILSPFTIWAVLSWLQGSFRFRLIPPSSPVACQVRLKVRLPESRFRLGDIHLFRTSSKRYFLVCSIMCNLVSRLPFCRIIAVMHTQLSRHRGYAHLVVTLSLLRALGCHITAARRTLLSYYCDCVCSAVTLLSPYTFFTRLAYV